MQLPPRPGHRHVQEPALLVDRVLRAGRHVGREVAVVQRQHVHGLPLEALGRVDRGEHQVILVEMRRTGQVGTRLRRIEHQLADETPQLHARLARRGNELVKVLQAQGAVRIAALDQRRQRFAQPLGAHAGRRLPRLAQCVHHDVRRRTGTRG